MTVFPAHGWLPAGAHFDWQRPDQGRDFVTNWKGIVQAPGSGVVLAISQDHPFPNGFGPAFPIVRIDSGPFAGHAWYIGHCTALVKAGQSFSFGTPLARADQGHNFNGTNGGWIELGNATKIPTGWFLGPNSPSGHWFDAILKMPLDTGTPTPGAVQMVDTLGSTLGRIPRAFWLKQRIAGYATGSGGIGWTDAEFAEFPNVVRIDQAAGTSMARGALVADVESGAKTIADAVKIAQARHQHGLPFTVYIQEGNLAACRAQMKAGGLPNGYVTYWIANWNFNEVGAEHRLGGDVVAVQWASPTSNPNTILPGSNLTLPQANADLSVTVPGWPKALPRPVNDAGAKGKARALVTIDLANGNGTIHGLPGVVSFQNPDATLASQITVAKGGKFRGRWTIARSK